MRCSIVLAIALIGVLTPQAGSAEGAPPWYESPPQIEGAVVAVAADDSKPEALAVALHRLTTQIKAEVRSMLESASAEDADAGGEQEARDVSTMTVVGKMQFGAVEIRSMEESFEERSGERTVDRHHELTIAVTLERPDPFDGRALMKYYRQATTSNGEEFVSTEFEFTRERCGFRAITAELEEAGMEITGEEGDDGQYYLMLVFDPAAVVK